MAFEDDFQRLIYPRLGEMADRLSGEFLNTMSFGDIRDEVMAMARCYGSSHLSGQHHAAMEEWVDKRILAGIDKVEGLSDRYEAMLREPDARQFARNVMALRRHVAKLTQTQRDTARQKLPGGGGPTDNPAAHQAQQLTHRETQ